ncbi:Uncharacterised protein [Achromobacter sp. 2789STDY5608633]|nr:Uncharacterised protein [Achromobacter sp. 2789STDY5608633]
MRSVSDGAPPLYGTCISGAPVSFWYSARVRCGGVPLPLEPAASGLAAAARARSAMVLIGLLALTTTMMGEDASPATGVRSRVRS